MPGMASAPIPVVEIPTELLNHTLGQLDEAESDRLTAAQNGTVKNDDSAYANCSYTLKTSTEETNRRHNRWANIFSCEVFDEIVTLRTCSDAATSFS